MLIWDYPGDIIKVILLRDENVLQTVFTAVSTRHMVDANS